MPVFSSHRTTDQLEEHIQLNHMVSKRFFHCYFDQKDAEDETKCDQCMEMFESKRELSIHVAHVHYQKTHNCELCEKVLKEKYILSGMLNQHMIQTIVNIHVLIVERSFRGRMPWLDTRRMHSEILVKIVMKLFAQENC